MNANFVRNVLKVAAICALGAPFVAVGANAQTYQQPYGYGTSTSQPYGYGTSAGYPPSGHYPGPGSSYQAANGGPTPRGNANAPLGGIYNGMYGGQAIYGHNYPERPQW